MAVWSLWLSNQQNGEVRLQENEQATCPQTQGQVCFFQVVHTEQGVLCCYGFVLHLPIFYEVTSSKGQRCGESLEAPEHSCPALVLLSLVIHAFFFPQPRLAQDLAPSHSCSVDRSISDMPTSMPMMIEVSESLLSGGWCSPEGEEREVIYYH